MWRYFEDERLNELVRRHASTKKVAGSRNRRHIQVDKSEDEITFEENKNLVLVIRGMVERFPIRSDLSVVLGRKAAGSASANADFDLSPYGALDRGVSRRHARLYVKASKLWITDLNSTNGTFLNGEQLKPNESKVVHRGSEVKVGHLPIEILF